MAYTTINKSTDHFNTKTYTGTGSSLALTGLGFQPDIVWQKVRSTTSSHRITDVVRGTGQVIYPNDTAQQSAENAVTAFGTDGFTVGTGNSNAYNANGATYVAWSWKAGNSQGSSNTDGTINTTYTSVNTTAGISISTYTGNSTQGATLGHGLGVAPKAIIIKSYTNAEQWVIGHNEMNSTNAWDYFMQFTSAARAQNNNRFGNVYPTSSVFTLGNEDQVNSSSKSYVAYCFAEKTGFSKFGKYTGNGNDNGAFVYTGFKPAFVLLKNTNTDGEWWVINDNKRNPHNIVDKDLFSNNSNVEAVHSRQDFVSNGFKFRSTANNSNKNGDEYVYMAFAENPLVGSNNIPALAR